MFGARSLASFSIVVSMMSSAANAAVIGMLYVGPENKAGLAVEKATTGDVFLLLDMNSNSKRVEFGVSPGTPFSRDTVIISPFGEPMAVLSIYSGEEQGLVNSKNVSIIDGANERSHQRTNLSQDMRDLAQAGYLRDKKGKTYSVSEIKEVSLVFQVRDSSGLETTLGLGHFKLAELQAGTVKQLAGETVAAKPATKVDPITQKINSLDEIRIQELPYEVVKSNIQKVLVEIGYLDQEAEMLTKEMLNFKNNNLRASEIIARHEANKGAMAKLGNNDRVHRAAQAAKDANSGKIDPKVAADKAGRK